MFLNKEDFNIKLVDFGLAFCWDEDLKTELRQKGLHKTMTGTVNYMPYLSPITWLQKCMHTTMTNDVIFGRRASFFMCSSHMRRPSTGIQ